MERQFITAVPAYGTTEAGADYRGLMPLIGQDMSDEMPAIIGVSLIRGHFTTWTEMHRSNFRCDPTSNLVPRLLYTNDKDLETLHERWMQWADDSLIEVEEGFPGVGQEGLERIARWGGVTPFKVTDTTCSTCAGVGLIVPVIAGMCWPADSSDPTDVRTPWRIDFPAEHIRADAVASHDKGWELMNQITEELWEDARKSWSPYEGEGDVAVNWTLSDLYEAGYEDEVHQMEETASEIIADRARAAHADAVYIPREPLTAWVSLLRKQTKAYVTRAHSSTRQISYAYEEGLDQWQRVTGL